VRSTARWQARLKAAVARQKPATASVVALFLGRGSLTFEAAALPGYLAALACAFLWSGYSAPGRSAENSTIRSGQR
jgi:uncharacterized membrane protein